MILLSTKGTVALDQVGFGPDDTLVFGSESTGAPEHVHRAAAVVARIPLLAGRRSLNVAVAAGIALHEALRQSGELPR